MNTPFWCKFPVGPSGCVEAPSADEAMVLAKTITGQEPVACDRLPYPANPRLNGKDGWNAEAGECPSFCYTPEQCKGHSCCPKRIGCVE